jgi:HPt (histidine-containing phosphotransfer) domain-containing protein
MPADITVEVHEELRALVPGFLANRQRDLQQLAHCLDQADFPAIRLIAHNMKGVGSGYGFDRVTELGEQLEDAAAAADAPATATVVADYQSYMQHCRVVFV